MFEKSVYELKNLQKIYTEELRELPSGHLIKCRNNGKDRYYITSDISGKKERKTVKENDLRMRQLARKEYLNRILKIVDADLRALEWSINKTQDVDPTAILLSMPRAYRELPQDFFFNKVKDSPLLHLDDETIKRCERHKEWAEEDYEKSSYKPENLKFLSSTGMRVRSKSELLIVETLDRFGVPFRYEQVVSTRHGRLTPDFTFQDCSGELFFWEHAGMMDNKEYRVSHERKMALYEKEGIVPWENLIVTYDVNGTINSPLIKSIIEYEVIPRL